MIILHPMNSPMVEVISGSNLADEVTEGEVQDILRVNLLVQAEFRKLMKALQGRHVHEIQVETLIDGAGYLTFVVYYEDNAS